MYLGRHSYTLIYPDGFMRSGKYHEIIAILQEEFPVLPSLNTIRKRFQNWGRTLEVERLTTLAPEKLLWFEGVEGFDRPVTAFEVWSRWVGDAGLTHPVPRTIRRRLLNNLRTKKAILLPCYFSQKSGRPAGAKNKVMKPPKPPKPPKLSVAPPSKPPKNLTTRNGQDEVVLNAPLKPITRCTEPLPDIKEWKGGDQRYYRRNDGRNLKIQTEGTQ